MNRPHCNEFEHQLGALPPFHVTILQTQQIGRTTCLVPSVIRVLNLIASATVAADVSSESDCIFHYGCSNASDWLHDEWVHRMRRSTRCVRYSDGRYGPLAGLWAALCMQLSQMAAPAARHDMDQCVDIMRVSTDTHQPIHTVWVHLNVHCIGQLRCV